MHLAYIIGTYPQPSETFIAREVEGLRARGHMVELFSLFAPSERADGVTYGWATRSARAMRKLAGGAAVRTLGQRWASEFAQRGCEGVVAHFGSLPSTVALEAAGDLPLIISLHARDLYVEAERLDEKIARAAAVVTCTQDNQHFLHTQFPQHAANIHLIYHGLPKAWLERPAPERKQTPGTSFRILAAGRLVEKKGFRTLLEAGALLKRGGVPVMVVILGDGPLYEELAEFSNHSALAGKVALSGWIEQQDIHIAYDFADVFCCPSIIAADGDRDGLPNVLVEAMSTGLPAVGSRLSGIPEAITDGETGFLVPPGDAAALAMALIRYTDPALRARHGAAARFDCLARFDGEVWLSKLERVLHGAIGSSSPQTNGDCPCP